LVISIAVKCSSKGSVFFIQERVGKSGSPFPLIKFRTMIQRAEENIPRWADKNDRRVTAIGSLLRRVRFDEIPQLINVLRGEMSIVGPRPERDYFVKNLARKIPCYSLRFSVKPGITGWAQVHLGYTASEEEALEKLEYDLFYIKHMSLFLDLKILLKTLKTILFGKGR
jgi:lipopolysaccharide/colanic/teichoic acid biosynthesis glycosyltransferase